MQFRALAGSFGGFGLAADNRFAAGKQPHEAIKVSVIDNPPVVGTKFRLVAIEFADRLR
jgi:hypothetical protein